MTRFQPLFETLGWAVLHSLWQGALILVLVLLARRLAGPTRPGAAYLAGLAGLLATFAAFLATVFVLVGTAGADNAANEIVASGAGAIAPVVPPSQSLQVAPEGAFDWRQAMPWLGGVWAMGFIVLCFQCMYAWARTRCYATIGLSDPSPEWTKRFADIVAQSGTATDIRLKVSALVESPVTLGTFKPLVLVPGSFLTGFPPEQVESILLHEIAHIRRYDFIVGLVQTAIRTTLYFNPAVRVMSRWVDEDREQACDDFAVRNTGRPLDLAKGLAALRLSLAPQPLMAANGGKGGPLITRLERLAGHATSARGLDRVSATAIAMAILAGTVWTSASYAHPPEAEEVRRILVFKGKVPPMPEMPAMPPMPPVPAVPELPAMTFNPFDEESTADFEARMEAWGATMEEWGEEYGEQMEETFGEEFEERMESWSEEMEAWGETLEAQSEAIEHLSEMSDSELAEHGLTRADVEVAEEAWGLSVAEGVVGGILPGFLTSEATSDIEKQRSKLDADALARVERALRDEDLAGGYAYGWSSDSKAKAEAAAKSSAARAKAEVKRAEAEAKRAEARSKRAEARAKREVERAERDAKRAQERAHKKHDHHSSSMTLEGDYSGDILDASQVSEELFAMLKTDGIISDKADGYVFKSSPKKLVVNGRLQNSDVHKRYRKYLIKQSVSADADLGIEVTKSRLELELRDADSNTRITMDR